MFRALLTIVLMALIALPQGVCFCPHAPAAEIPAEKCCHETEDAQPASPCPPPSDHDEEEHDCSCKLMQVLASDAPVVSVERAQLAGLLHVSSFDAIDVVGSQGRASIPSFRIADGPIPLILCALRI